MKPTLTLLFILCVHCASVVQSDAAETTKPNVLFIVADAYATTSEPMATRW